MTDSDNNPAPGTAPDSGSFFGNLFNLYFEPAATFGKIFAKPRALAALALQIGIGVLFATVWFQHMDAREFMRRQMEMNPRIQQMPTEQVERILDAQTRFMQGSGRVLPFVAPVVLDLLLAGFFMFVFRFFIAADVSFKQSFTAVAWSFAAIGLIQTPLILLVMYLKGDWNVSPDQVLQANPGMFLDQTAVARWLFALVSSIDLFTFWTIFLLATGYSVAAKRGLGTGLWAIGLPWGLYVLAKVAFFAIVS